MDLAETPFSQTSEVPSKSSTKFVIAIGMITLTALSGLFLLFRVSQTRQQSSQTSLTPTLTMMPTVINPSDDWLTYKNSKYGYSLRYPKNFTVQETLPTTCQDETGLPISGCYGVAEKGDDVFITNNGSPYSSSFSIRTKEKSESYYPPPDFCIDANFYSVKEIILNNQTVYEIYAKGAINTDSSQTIDLYYLDTSSGYSYKDGNTLAEKQLCYKREFIVNNLILSIFADPPSILPEDFATIEKIISTLNFTISN